MHGRPRPPKGFQPPAEFVAAQERKTKLLKNATGEVLRRRKEEEYGPEGVALSSKLLALNPEVYTAWNYRREALLQVLGDDGESIDGKREVSERELQVSAEALKRNPKSYSAWYQRRWILRKGYCVPHREFGFVEERLNEDERNFHAWNYRQFLVGFTGRSAQEELEFSRKKIEQNFGNFSAWHYRTKFLPLVHHTPVIKTLSELTDDGSDKKVKSAPDMAVPLKVLDEEYEIVHSAFATDSEDSSAWFYFRWLLRQSFLDWERKRGSDGEIQSQDTLLAVLEREKKWLEQDLLSLDPKAKWPCLATTWIEEMRHHCLNPQDGTSQNEAKAKFDLLASLDKQRGGFYQDVVNRQASVVT